MAQIAMPLLRFLSLKSTWLWSLSNLAARLRFTLLTEQDVWAWLDAPLVWTVVEPPQRQASLFASDSGQQIGGNLFRHWSRSLSSSPSSCGADHDRPMMF